MSLLVVGSVALDTVTTPFGTAEETLGGSAVFFSASAAHFCSVRLVGVIGDDFPEESLEFLVERGVDLAGLTRADGESFRWSGEYSYDLNTARTRETRLGVFADFKPTIPEAFRGSDWVFLGNIHPQLQLDVLKQVRSPRLVACDTMNYWISSERTALIRLLRRVGVLLVNDAEIRALSGEHNLLRAARWVHEHGPGIVVVKKGEHGAMLFHRDVMFFAPGFPLEDIFDPTGAGDAFAGGFLGALARCGSSAPPDLKRAMIYGSVMGSFAVERFGVERLKTLRAEEVEDRVRHFRELTSFEQVVPEALNA
ncbi:MAG: PfkB family carbohydrate kinase [Longimicrobiales bacterium]